MSRRSGPRFLLYSHDGMGLGHVRRNLAISRALVSLAPDASVLLVAGADDVNAFDVPPGVDVVKFPGLCKLANDRYEGRRLPMAASEILGIRAAVIEAVARSFEPAVLLADKHPFGLGGELRGALEAARAAGGRTAFGMRDVLDEPATVLREWGPLGLPASLADHHDLVLVYGRRDILDPVAAYGFPPAVVERTRYTGYVGGVRSRRPGDGLPSTDDRPLVLATAGGGDDGADLLRTFIRASAGATWRSSVVAGPYCVARKELRGMAEGAGVGFQVFARDLPDRFGSVDALVCMGGYNTLVEALSVGTPTICVPRAWPRIEQKIRAEAFARLGLLHVLDPIGLQPSKLRREIELRLAAGPGGTRAAVAARARAAFGTGGAERAARYLLQLADAGASVPQAAAAR